MAATAVTLAVLLLAVLLFLRPPAAAGQELDDEEFSYVVGSENGPENWGNIREEWAVCGDGRLQSPIDIDDERVSVSNNLGRLKNTYREGGTVLRNRGHDIMLRWEEDVGGILINDTEYSLKQIHWHTPSEHKIDGQRYHMEAHMVHESVDKKIVVVGILYRIGCPDTFLFELESYIRKLADLKGEEVRVGLVDPRQVHGESIKYYRYIGSLTTPPCTEGVIWTIIKKVRTVSRKQIKLLREAVHDCRSAIGCLGNGANREGVRCNVDFVAPRCLGGTVALRSWHCSAHTFGCQIERLSAALLSVCSI